MRCNSATTSSAADFTRRDCIAICARKAGWFISWIPSFNVGLTRGVYQVEYACDPPNVSKARAMILRDLKEMQTQKVTAQELHQAKLMLLRDIPLAESSVDYIANGWLA